MSRFTDILRSVDSRLDLPRPAKDRILLEIAADLEDLFEFYLEHGLGEEEARSLTESRFEFSDLSLAELVEVHRSGLRGFMDHLSTQTQTRWEQTLLALLLVLVAATGGPAVVRSDFFRQAGPFIWPVLGIGVAAGTLSLAKFCGLFVRRERDLRTLRKGLPSLLLLATASMIVGLYGFSVELYLAFRKLAFNPDGVWLFVIEWLQRGSPVLLLGLIVTLVTAVIWFALVHRVRSIEQREIGLLLAE